jgi:hypothetical protein
MNLRAAVAAVERHHIVLAFPIENRTEPMSLWRHFHPRTPMRWEWDASGDSRVVALWHLRTRLSTSRLVVYSKWFRGRATFFSREMFVAMLALLRAQPLFDRIPRESRSILDTLELDSPMSSRRLREATELQGAMLESLWNRSTRALWTRLAIVGFGEVDDGAFPSLAIGATKTLFEDLWLESEARDLTEARSFIDAHLSRDNLFRKQFDRDLKALSGERVGEK